jgi:hypothetical protein
MADKPSSKETVCVLQKDETWHDRILTNTR